MEGLDNRLRRILPSAWPALLSSISEIDEFKGWWRGRFEPRPSSLGELRKRVAVLSANASIRIGWSGLPRPPAGLPPVPPAARPAAGMPPAASAYAQLLKTVFDGYAEMPLSRELLLQLHADLLKYSPRDQAHRGAYRSAAGRSVFFPRRTIEAIALRPSDPHLIPKEMEGLIHWTNSRLASATFHPLLVAAGFLLEFLSIRPFADGNGRMSRLLTNLILLRCGYAYMPYASLEKTIEDQKAEYYLALRKSQASRNLPSADLTTWLTAFLNAMRTQARGLRGLLERQPREGRLSANQTAVMALFERQREVTNRIVRDERRLPRETAKQVLSRLVALSLIERVGAGRAARYRKRENRQGQEG